MIEIWGFSEDLMPIVLHNKDVDNNNDDHDNNDDANEDNNKFKFLSVGT